MSKIGTLTSFRHLLDDESVILIPKVQRDYAYGRNDDKVAEIIDGMLDTILEAIQNDTVVILDFVYGGTYEDSGLIPLDGQQRLTTLFLLFYYASIIQNDVSQVDVNKLLKFRYETRQSATSFIESLINDIRTEVIATYNDSIRIKDLIKDNPKYLPSYDTDPTIDSMLNVLEKIENKCHSTYHIEDLWTKLNTRDNVRFYALSLDKFGLTDDLYIKMNSRGKKLTQFEIFKSDLEKAINKISPELKDEISIKIDNSWMDVLWVFAQNTINDVDFVKRADDGFMHLFNNVFRMELFRRKIEAKKNRVAEISEIIYDRESITDIISIFDFMSKIHKNGGIQDYWDRFFYFSDNQIGRDNLIRLFWQQKQNHKPVFYLAMERDLSVPEFCYFYALYLIGINNKSFIESFKILRTVRNLVTANVRANSARYDMLKGFFTDIEELIVNNGVLSDTPHTFISTACEEEIYKTNEIDDSLYNSLLKYENHSILQGSVMLFIENYYKENKSSKCLINSLFHFESVFNDESPSCFDKIRIAFLNNENEYMQYDHSMETETKDTRRMFIHNVGDFSRFFIRNKDRRNQKAIIDILQSNIISLNTLKEPKEKCKEFAINSWQYYMAKYKGANIEGTKYGYYVWDDKRNKPMEIIILNSSYHSIYNIEWKMLNHILYTELGDEEHYSLDSHASSALSLNKCGVTITIVQDGWKVGCNDEKAIAILKDTSELYSIKPFMDEDSYFIIDFIDKDSGLDYIDLGIQIVHDFENIYRYNDNQREPV